MSNDPKQGDHPRDAESELAVDDLKPHAATAEEAEKVRGGLSDPGPPGVPIPYPNVVAGGSTSGGTKLTGVSTASGRG